MSTPTSKKSGFFFWLALLVGTAVAWWLFSILGGVSRAAQLGQWELAGQIFLTRAALAAHALFMPVVALPIGALFCLLPLALSLDKESNFKAPIAACGAIAFVPPAAWLAGGVLAEMLGADRAPASVLWWWVGGIAAGCAAAFAWLRFGVGHAERLRRLLTKKSQLERNRRTDVREIDQFLPSEIGQFDPLHFVQPDRGFFVGLDEFKNPIFIPCDAWRLSHVLLSGRTRSGKGVAAQILLSQAIARGEFVVVLDPKLDAWMPHVFHQAALRAGQPYTFLDLRPGQPPQINMFHGCDEETAESMLIASFSLAEKGEAADFYRLADRKATREAARYIAGGHTAADALAALGEQWINRAAGFHAAIEEMADLPSVNAAKGGIDVAALARSGGCLYVSGDMGNTRIIRMQRMLLVRLMMLAKATQHDPERRLITVFADEFKVHISRPFMTSLGAAAGWGLHCILAFQSLQDLADVPGDLDKDSVKGAVMENCAIQLSYRIKDPDTAEWLAASTGIILVDDETRKIERNLALTETVLPERSVRMAERFLIDTNMIMNLPAGCGALVGATKLPAFCYTSPVVVSKRPEAITPTAAAAPAAVQAAQAPAGAGAAGVVAVVIPVVVPDREDFL